MKKAGIIRIILAVIIQMNMIGILSQTNRLEKSGITISFDDSAARYVLENPEKALKKERDSIWNSFEGYRITSVWHEKSYIPVAWQIWENGLNKFLYKDTTLINKSLTLADSLKCKANREQNKIAYHISSYLGEETKLHAQIYFVAFTIPYAFCVEENKIGIDITGGEWNFDTDCILNTTIHEIYHVGFRLNSPDYYKYIEPDPINKETFIRFNYAYLQSEGMATYVGYKALDLFPSTFKHEDYNLLEDDNKVKNAIDQINTLCEMAKTVPLDSLLIEAWNVGVEERAYYVTGAYMAQKIEEKYGTKHLAELVNKGSMQFVRDYNAVVLNDYKIVLVEF